MSGTDRQAMVDHLINPITNTGGRYYLIVFSLFLGVCWGLFAWSQ